MPLFDLASARDKRQPGPRATLPPPEPKKLRYQEMIEFIERLVAQSRLEPGDLLPTQAELASMAGVSLITVRRALEELERARRMRRHQGVGTYLAQRAGPVWRPARHAPPGLRLRRCGQRAGPAAGRQPAALA